LFSPVFLSGIFVLFVVLSAAAEHVVQVTVRNVWGGSVTIQLPRVSSSSAASAAGGAAVNVTSPDSVAAVSAFGVNALAQAARAGSLNDVSQVWHWQCRIDALKWVCRAGSRHDSVHICSHV
jgi:hypothetical protein